MDNPTQRRLAAIVVADVVGYSRLASCCARIVKIMGDGKLTEFSSVVNATQ